MLWALLLGAVACADMPAGQTWGRLTGFPSGSKTIQRGSPDQGYALAAWDAHAHNPRPRRGFSPFPGRVRLQGIRTGRKRPDQEEVAVTLPTPTSLGLLSLLVPLTLVPPALAQQSTRPRPVLSPEVHADRQVTFRLRAPSDLLQDALDDGGSDNITIIVGRSSRNVA